MTLRAPLFKAVKIVDVARRMSITTTVLPLISSSPIEDPFVNTSNTLFIYLIFDERRFSDNSRERLSPDFNVYFCIDFCEFRDHISHSNPYSEVRRLSSTSYFANFIS